MRRFRRALLGACVLVLLLGGTAAVVFRQAILYLNAPGPLAEARPVVVPRGSPLRLGEVLQGEGVLHHAVALRIAAQVTNAEGPLRAGAAQQQHQRQRRQQGPPQAHARGVRRPAVGLRRRA